MTNHLFLVGIDKYLFQRRLNNCVKDAKDIKDILIEKFDFDDQNIHELYDKDATSSYIQGALRSYALKLTLEDSLVIYFSGHGHFDTIIDRGFWVPVEGTGSYTTWIPNDVILTYIEKIPCKHIFIISDSCFSTHLLVSHPTKTIEEYANRKSRWALTSSFQEAYDSDPGNNGPFAKAILEYLHKSERDFRIGELIEFVKAVFQSDKLQSPQGSPLYCRGHSAGEMVFYLKRSLDNRSFKGYSDFLRILKLYKRNSQFHLLSTYEDLPNKIGFQIYHEVDSVVKKVTYYLYLYQGSSHSKTRNYLVDNHPQIFKDKNLILFLTKENIKTDLPTHLQNAKEKFKPISAFYIDDFIREQCTPKITVDPSTSYLSISNFVLPSFAHGLQAKDVKSRLDLWFTQTEEPILVLKGTGGIGKTTFAQYVADQWIARAPEKSVLFIDSIQIKDILITRKSQSDGLSIYDFYDAFWQVHGGMSERLTEDLFTINIDAGNILLVIDGLDEVISKVSSFNVDTFLNSINSSCKVIGSGKVIIVCRTQFWEKSEKESLNAKIIELEPFNENQAKLFFERSLDSNNKVRKALKMAEDFKYPGSESSNVFHPYVLDIIRSIISLGKEVIEIDMSEFTSKQLSRNLNNDYIIYRVCDRERKRVGQISVDDQVIFFIYLATEKRGVVKAKIFRDFIEEALGKKVNATNALALTSHPFLVVDGENISFKYDFLGDMFKGMYLSALLNLETSRSPLPDEFLQVVEENCWYGSGINSDVVHRLEHWNEYDLLLLSEYIHAVDVHLDIVNERKLKLIGNLFSLALEINQRFSGNDVKSNTALLKFLFANEDTKVERLVVTGIGIEENVRFDFSNLIFNNCYFNAYGSFWDCKFNENTKFTASYLLNLISRTDRQPLSKSNFIDCVFDKDVEETLAKFEETSSNKIEKIKTFLNNFFHLFLSGGKLGRQWEHKIIHPRFSGISQNRFHYAETISLLRKHKVVQIDKEVGKNKMFINEIYKEDVVRFIKDGTISPLIVRLIKDFSQF